MQKPITSSVDTGSFEAKRAPLARRLAALALACVTASGSAALAQEEPPLDEELQFVLDNGFQSFIFAQTCRSIGEAGDVIEGESLPVGGGRHLECETAPMRLLQTIDTQASTGERFCAIGQLIGVQGTGDPRLAVSVASTPDGAPWVLLGTHDGEEITIGRVTGPAGGTAFPLIVDARFDVTEVRPNPEARFCDEVFGL